MRKLILNIHRYAGLFLGIFLLIMGVTGALLAFRNHADCWFHPALCRVEMGSSHVPLDELSQKIGNSLPGLRLRSIILPSEPDQPTVFDLGAEGQSADEKDDEQEFSVVHVYVDGYNGKTLGSLQGSGFMGTLEKLHSHFLLEENVGEVITGGLSLLLVGLALSGTILWWRYKRFRVRWNAGWMRRWFDIHIATGIFSFVVLLFLGLTGTMLAFSDDLDPWLFRLFPAAAPAQSAGSPLPSYGGPVTLDQSLELARKALPGATPRSIRGGGAEPIIVSLRFPEDDSREGRSRVWINGVTGNVTQIRSARNTTTADRILILNYALHTGEFFGLPTRMILSISTIFLILQVISGYYMWWKRRKPSGK